MRNKPYSPVQAQRPWKPTVLFWIVAALLLLVIIPFAIAGGFGLVLLVLGLIALLTGLYAWVFKRRSWVGLPHRKSGGVVAIAGFLALIVGTGVVGATASPGRDAAEPAGAVESATPTPTPTPTNPALTPCATDAATQEYDGVTFVCALGEEDEGFIWLTQEDADRYAAERAAVAKAAADKAAAEKAAAAKAAAAKAAAEKAAAEKAAADKAAAEKAAAETAAAQKAAADQAAREEAARVAAEQAAVQVPPAPVAPTAAYYANCSEAKAAGAAPLYTNSPGYRSGLDRDGDGVACEK